MKIQGEVKGPSETKRFYLPGIKVSDQCPKCGETNCWNGNDEYISYPPFGTPFELDFCCACEAEWVKVVMLNLTLTEVV